MCRFRFWEEFTFPPILLLNIYFPAFEKELILLQDLDHPSSIFTTSQASPSLPLSSLSCFLPLSLCLCTHLHLECQSGTADKVCFNQNGQRCCSLLQDRFKTIWKPHTHDFGLGDTALQPLGKPSTQAVKTTPLLRQRAENYFWLLPHPTILSVTKMYWCYIQIPLKPIHFHHHCFRQIPGHHHFLGYIPILLMWPRGPAWSGPCPNPSLFPLRFYILTDLDSFQFFKCTIFFSCLWTFEISLP